MSLKKVCSTVKEWSLFENDAFRKTSINAFVHNKWVNGTEPMITVFSDRIEILSRGTLPPEQTLEGFFAGESIPVNKKLSEIFLQLHISEKTGRGVPKITETYGRNVYEFWENSIAVTIPFNWIKQIANENAQKRPEAKKNDSENPYSELNATQQKIILLMKENPRISIQRIAENCGKDVSTIKKAVAALKIGGFIEHVGANKN